jgi:hypothetical protein
MDIGYDPTRPHHRMVNLTFVLFYIRYKYQYLQVAIWFSVRILESEMSITKYMYLESDMVQIDNGQVTGDSRWVLQSLLLGST